MKGKKIHLLDNPLTYASELPDETEKYTTKQNADVCCNKCNGTGVIKDVNIQKKRFAIDFDNTLTVGDNKPWLEDDRPTPNKKNIEIVNQLFFKGNTIIIHSSRPWEFARKTVAWLIENRVLYHNMSIKEFEAIK